jgi:hypothetical protein
MPPRRVDNPPQVANLPHIRRSAGRSICLCPVVGKPSGIVRPCVRHDGTPVLSRIPTVAAAKPNRAATGSE